MDASQSDTKYTKVTASDAQSFVEGILTGNSVSKENASIIAKCLVQADLRGVDTHGINRIPSYMDRIRRGVLDPEATPSLTKITPVVAQVSDPIPRRTCQSTDNFAR
jgi:LDH2 family malate/lactate/ureidoglycolate dehydrogenase